ncbi:MAG: BsuBI/PstI family type II restriction endonuclease [Rhodospirillaceae bacterium]|nr:BsuBI/PstI family type II restriction endonuclease [Rhodospirillaceae bacterium]MDE0254245.1 BsuBI/PstI family type II restriction endonuclease [Rhodospirillaceae bacterium]MDE0617309.1 BsuBI/PstI family type II restriction endonuclease [Rhodospirillaceae bacterium]
MLLPPLLPVPDIHERLQAIFPEGTANRNYVTREIAAKTVFVMLYIGAVDGEECWLRPDQVTRMSDAQAAQEGDSDRAGWLELSMRPTTGDIDGRWYAANTRESIRDETLREGLVRIGAVKEREGLPTTSPLPRYALAPDFAALFDPSLTEDTLNTLMEEWRAANLSKGALARVAIMRRGAVAREAGVLVTFPNGETRHMEPGPSSVISKAVVEEFATRFLGQPGVIWLSESRNQVVARDDGLAQDIGLAIEPDRNLPDLILVDLEPVEPLLVFVEVVATAGPVTEGRQAALMAIATEAGFSEGQVAFLTAYADRNEAAFKDSVSELAWRSFAWFMSEPDHILLLHEGADTERARLSELMRM